MTTRVTPPRSEQIHHVNKRRGAMLIDTTQWLAVSAKWHDHIETNKGWARENGYLKDF